MLVARGSESDPGNQHSQFGRAGLVFGCAYQGCVVLFPSQVVRQLQRQSITHGRFGLERERIYE
jgi:hypothetical protein